MGPEMRNEAARFVTLIDALYENKVKLLASAPAEPEDLYPAGDGRFEFERTVSRLDGDAERGIHGRRATARCNRAADRRGGCDDCCDNGGCCRLPDGRDHRQVFGVVVRSLRARRQHHGRGCARSRRRITEYTSLVEDTRRQAIDRPW
jgi:hypothetical protein